MNYICKKSLHIEEFDDDGFSTEKYKSIEKGACFHLADSSFRLIGGADTIRLESADGTWLEILRETLDEHFEEVVEGEHHVHPT